MVTLVTNVRDYTLRRHLQKAQELIQPETLSDTPSEHLSGNLFLHRLVKIKQFSVGALSITGEQLSQLFQQKIQVKVDVYYSTNDYRQALGYSKEGETASEGAPIIHLNGARLDYACESEIVATVIHELAINLIIHAKGGFFEKTSVPVQVPERKELVSYSLAQVTDDYLTLTVCKPFVYGSFVFHNDGQGYEVPRNELYDFLKKEVRKEICCCCFSFF